MTTATTSMRRPSMRRASMRNRWSRMTRRRRIMTHRMSLWLTAHLRMIRRCAVNLCMIHRCWMIHRCVVAGCSMTHARGTRAMPRIRRRCVTGICRSHMPSIRRRRMSGVCRPCMPRIASGRMSCARGSAPRGMIRRSPRHRRIRRPAAIHFRQLIPVMRRRLLMLHLRRSSAYMPLMHRRLLLRIWPRLHPGPAVKARTACCCISNDGPVHISIMDNRRVHAGNSRIIAEMPAIPLPAPITYPTITKTIIDPAIKPYVRPPIPGMPAVYASGKTPITRGPQKTNRGRRIPVTRHPIVTGITIGPITRYPNISVYRTGRLLIYGNGRRGYVHRKAHAYLRLNPGGRNPG